MKRRGATSLAGIMPLDKPAGMTSHDVVAAVRRATGEGRVGHAGTLDPMATGLLVVLVGSYTRLAPYLTSATKSYDATISFGSETDTDDAEGAVTRTVAVPPGAMDVAFAQSTLDGFLGDSSQEPPAFSAIKQDGKTAHRAARSGSPLDLPPRDVRVDEAVLIGVSAGDASWRVRFTVSKGTYVRALARDIGRAIGSAAHLSALRRTSSGTVEIGAVHTLVEVEAAAAAGTVTELFTDPLEALSLPVVTGTHVVATGGSLPVPADLHAAQGSPVAVTLAGELAAVYRVGESMLTPAVVLSRGVDS